VEDDGRGRDQGDLADHVDAGHRQLELVEKLLVDFVSQMSATGSLMGSYESTERLIARFMPEEKVSQIMEEIRGPAGRTMWDKLANVNETVLANYLKNEYPADRRRRAVQDQAGACRARAGRAARGIRARSGPAHAAHGIRAEGHSRQGRAHLRVEFMSNLARTAKRDAHEHMAEIFNNFDRQTESRFLTALEERSRDSAERIKALMFTFEDLGKLDPGSIQTLLRHVEKDKLGLALKGATDTLRDVFFSNMSERAGKILREDMEAMGPVRLKDVDEAQMRMVNVAKDLANKGEIMIASKQGEDELIY
jgi:flagellar motor switch protein FliG